MVVGIRSSENERDLGQAWKAFDQTRRRLAAARVKGGDTHALGGVYGVMKGIVQKLRFRPLVRATDREREAIRRVLGVDALPPVADPIPAACKVLPLKPPSRDPEAA